MNQSQVSFYHPWSAPLIYKTLLLESVPTSVWLSARTSGKQHKYNLFKLYSVCCYLFFKDLFNISRLFILHSTLAYSISLPTGKHLANTVLIYQVTGDRVASHCARLRSFFWKLAILDRAFAVSNTVLAFWKDNIFVGVVFGLVSRLVQVENWGEGERGPLRLSPLSERLEQAVGILRRLYNSNISTDTQYCISRTPLL